MNSIWFQITNDEDFLSDTWFGIISIYNILGPEKKSLEHYTSQNRTEKHYGRMFYGKLIKTKTY